MDLKSRRRLSLDGTAGSDGLSKMPPLQAGAHFIEVTVTDTTGKSRQTLLPLMFKVRTVSPPVKSSIHSREMCLYKARQSYLQDKQGDADIPVTDCSLSGCLIKTAYWDRGD